MEGMLPQPFVGTLVVLLAASLGLILAFRRFGIPTPVAYILTGVGAGPSGVALLSETDHFTVLGEAGVLFLMFYAGLKFSLPVLAASKRSMLLVGSAEVAGVCMLGAALGLALGFRPLDAVLVGGALAMSSTAITLRQLEDDGELTSPEGKIAVGVLLFQDIATLPFLIVVATLSEGNRTAAGGIWADLGLTLLTGVLAFVAAIVIGRRILLRAVQALDRVGSHEVFTIAMLLLILGAGWAAQAIDLSPPLGAFLAGMVLGETELKHRAEGDLRPFRDVLLGLFFVSIGLHLNLSVIVTQPLLVAAAVAGLVSGKAAAILPLVRLSGERGTTALRAAIILAHGGEFGLLILTLAGAGNVLPPEVVEPLLVSIVLSMMTAPFLITHSGAIARALWRSGCSTGGASPP